MGYIGIESIKESYAKKLSEENLPLKAYDVINKDTYKPIFYGFSYHPEDEPFVDDMNLVLQDISMDIASIDYEIANTSEKYVTLMNNLNSRITFIDEAITNEENRIKDINIVCSYYDEFTNIKPLNGSNVTGNAGTIEKITFSAEPSNTVIHRPTVISVDGNGYAGNKFVYNNDKFTDTIVDTGNFNNLIDNNSLTKFEYSRISINNTNNAGVKLPIEFNFDNEPAKCTITLYNKNPFEMLKLDLGNHNIVLEDMLFSTNDGVSYISCLPKPLDLNNPDEKYRDPNYIYCSGILAFPSTKFLKLKFSSKETFNEIIAFKNINVTDTTNHKEEVIEVLGAKRNVITINDISLITSEYEDAIIETNELISIPINSIAIYANEYIPSYFNDEYEYIEYYLTVNGEEYKVEPINSNKIGTKIIRVSNFSIIDKYVLNINESIKSAKLKVVIKKGDNKSTPLLSNLKICYGKVNMNDVV